MSRANKKLKLSNPQKGEERKNFKWEIFHMDMAHYVSDNYNNYKKALASTQKIGFLRQMRDFLKIAGCTDTQLKNGFYTFLKKYTNVKQKLNQSGFGVDPEKDKTLDKGWILRECPYFEILDEVMGTRPNVTPPCIVSTTGSVTSPSLVLVEGTGVNHSSAGESTTNELNSEIYENVNEDREIVLETDDELLDIGESDNEELVTENAQVGVGKESSEQKGPKAHSANLKTSHYVKQALSGLDLKKGPRLSAKTPMSIFAQVMEDKNSQLVLIEEKKLQFQERRLDADQKIKKEKNEIELLKVNSEMDLEKKKLELEQEKIAERRAEREHELQVLKITQEFELKKLELQQKHNNQ